MKVKIISPKTKKKPLVVDDKNTLTILGCTEYDINVEK